MPNQSLSIYYLQSTTHLLENSYCLSIQTSLHHTLPASYTSFFIPNFHSAFYNSFVYLPLDPDFNPLSSVLFFPSATPLIHLKHTTYSFNSSYSPKKHQEIGLSFHSPSPLRVSLFIEGYEKFEGDERLCVWMDM